jgi:two-component system cell cycle response regulator DivK
MTVIAAGSSGRVCSTIRSAARDVAEPAPLILLIDDNDDHRSMYAMYLRSVGFRVLEAPDGTSGVGNARAHCPDAILLDLYMPGLNGWQACRWLKSSIETSRIPVIALTGHAVEQAGREAMMKAGCDRFVVKGVDPGRVVQVVREVLEGK